jgi:phage tail sheath protein FI
MSQTTFGAANITTTEVDNSIPVVGQPTGVPACVIGTTQSGPAFVPSIVSKYDEWKNLYGQSDGKKFAALAANEWLNNQQSLVTVKVLGVGDGKQRIVNGTYAGSVNNAGFTVGEQQPQTAGFLGSNQYANVGGPLGRLYFLGAFMSESVGSDVLSSAGLQTSATSAPILRAVLMAPSGVIMRLSSSIEGTSSAPVSSLVAADATAKGNIVGSVVLMDSGTPKQEFTLLLNGHKGTDPSYPNFITASLDVTANNYFGNVFNTDPLKLEKAGHYLYTQWDVHPTLAVVTGTGLITPVSGAGGSLTARVGVESSAFLTTGSLARNTGDSYTPNYESFTDRFSHAVSPWVVSQKFGGSPANLFRLHAIDDGASQASSYKISIENISTSQSQSYKYGTFDVVIRDWKDSDINPIVLERFAAVCLDPESSRYISKVIGDLNIYYDFDRVPAEQRIVTEGATNWSSAYVRVEVSQNVDSMSVDPTALPMGFRGIYHPTTSGSMPLTSIAGTQLSSATVLKKSVIPPVPFRSDITAGSGIKQIAESKYYWGVQFEHVESLTTKNSSFWQNEGVVSMTKYLPGFATLAQNFCVGDNTGVADTAQNGIMDADRFCRNLFTLENIAVVTSSSGIADPTTWVSARYVRQGGITPNDTAKTRALSVSDLTTANKRFTKFSMFLQGGFDGVNIFDSDESQINNAAVTADMNDSNRGLVNGPSVSSYVTALNITTGVENMDIQLLVVPGIRNPVITNKCISAVDTRFDAVAVIDIEQVDNLGNAVTTDDQVPSVSLTTLNFKNRSLDSSFAATYFPDVVMSDVDLGTNITVPPSVPAVGVIALNDAIGQPWTAPAGNVRGVMPRVLEAKVNLNSGDMDVLADASINPIVSFPGNAVVGSNPKGGVLAWGQKNLQKTASSLDRLSVRRLLISLRRDIRDVAYTFQFEPDVPSTMASFSKAVDPILKRAQSLKGLSKYKVIIDTTTTTLADVQNKVMKGIIYVKPMNATESINLSFKINNATVSFNG